jgi:hypothetical protein
MKAMHLEEPALEFGNGGRHPDIRFGLMAHGPLDQDTAKAPREIRVGVVGTPDTIEGVTAWLEHCKRGIPAKESRQPNLFPRYPGDSPDSAFRVNLLISQDLHATISPGDITRVAKGNKEALTDAVQLFIDESRHLVEKAHPNVLICAPPADLLDALEGEAPVQEEDEEESGPTKAAPRRRARTGPRDIPWFHDVLKARAMSLASPIQMVRPETYDPKKRRQQRNPFGGVRRLQDDATRAWNFHTALYYKAGGTPWRLGRSATDLTACYVGVSFYRTPDRERLMTSVAQVFNERGDGVIVRGGQARYEKEDRQVHLSEADALALLLDALKTYRREHKTTPARIVIHKSSGFNEAEIAGFRAAATEERIDSIDLLSLRESSTRVFRTRVYPPLRGTLISLDERTHLLYSRGSVDFFATWPGMYVPHPLELRCERVDQTPLFLAQEILALTKMNWNNTQFDGGDPITLRAAEQVGDILKHVTEGGPIHARYSYYM